MRKAPSETIKAILGLTNVGICWTGVWLGLKFWGHLWPVKYFSLAVLDLVLILALSMIHTYINSWLNPSEKLRSLHDD